MLCIELGVGVRIEKEIWAGLSKTGLAILWRPVLTMLWSPVLERQSPLALASDTCICIYSGVLGCYMLLVGNALYWICPVELYLPPCCVLSQFEELTPCLPAGSRPLCCHAWRQQ